MYFTSQKPGESCNTVAKQLVKLKPTINEKAHHVSMGPVTLEVNGESPSHVSCHLPSVFSKVLYKRDEHRKQLADVPTELTGNRSPGLRELESRTHTLIDPKQ